MNLSLFPLLSLILWAAVVAAQETTQPSPSATTPLAPVRAGGQSSLLLWTHSEALQVEHGEDSPVRQTILVIDAPPITAAPFQIEGEISYRDVAADGAEQNGEGRLEAIATFPIGDPIKVRTDEKEGPAEHLRGSSDWRVFGLEFNIGATYYAPTRLELAVVLPGKGTVQLRNVRLIQDKKEANLRPAQAEEVWKRPELIEVEHTGPGPLLKHLLTINAPPIIAQVYQLEGEVAYDVTAAKDDPGYLEMWNQFPKEGRAFSRTLASEGGLGRLQGSSDWRRFILPFDATGANSPPSLLEFNVRVPGPAKVWLRNLRLIQVKSPSGTAHPGANAVTPPGSRAEGSPAGSASSTLHAGLKPWVYVVGGVALLAVLSLGLEWLARGGQSPHLVLWSARVLTGLGVAAVVGAAFAISLRPAHFLWHVVLFGGVWCVLWFPARLRHHQQHYRELELRRMSAADVI